jgi:hypothetical protein
MTIPVFADESFSGDDSSTKKGNQMGVSILLGVVIPVKDYLQDSMETGFPRIIINFDFPVVEKTDFRIKMGSNWFGLEDKYKLDVQNRFVGLTQNTGYSCTGEDITFGINQQLGEEKMHAYVFQFPSPFGRGWLAKRDG